jgi:hypothetical protein
MIEVFDVEQGTPEWFECRRGIPTASMFATVMASGRSGGESKTRAKYLRQLAGEIITGEIMETYSNAHMDRGKEMEAEARRHYAFMTDTDPQLVGFVRNGGKGCSPDSLVGDKGMLEIKSKLPDLLIECIERDDFPPEHKAQCQGNLWVAEREWIDITVYWRKMPQFTKRAYRDEVYIATMAKAVKAFNEELGELVERVRAYSDPDHLKRQLVMSNQLAQNFMAG